MDSNSDPKTPLHPQVHEWKPVTLTMIHKGLETIKELKELDEKDQEFFNLTEQLLHDDMKAIWLWIKNKLHKVWETSPTIDGDWHFGQFGVIVGYHVRAGLKISKWDTMSNGALKSHVDKLIRDINSVQDRIEDSPIDINALQNLSENEFQNIIDEDEDPETNIFNYDFDELFPSMRLSKVLSLYTASVQGTLDRAMAFRTYKKPRKGIEDKYVRRHYFVVSMYELTTKYFKSPSHDFVSEISRIILKDPEIDTSIVRSIYDRAKDYINYQNS
jgi:hypothetical protein